VQDRTGASRENRLTCSAFVGGQENVVPDDQSESFIDSEASTRSPFVDDFPSKLPKFSLKASPAVFLSVGLLLFLLGRFNFLLIHTLIELSSIILLTAVFLIGWNTRHLVRGQFFVLLAVGFLASGMVDLLHTLTFKGMHIVPVSSTNMATQLWLIGRTLSAFAFLTATLSLEHRDVCSARAWLVGFLSSGAILSLLVWPLGVFPACFVEGVGQTPFKVAFEYIIVVLLCLAAGLLWLRSRSLNRPLLVLLLLAIGMSIVSELLFTIDGDAYSFMNFLGHYFKLGGVVLVYYALVEGTLHAPFSTLFRDMSLSYKELNLELNRRVAAERQQEVVHQEASLLYRMSRAMHSTLNLDDLAHLMLSAATGVDAGGFERAMLFTVNQRTGMLQGMLGVSQELAPLILPAGENRLAWDELHLDEQSREAQRMSPFNQQVIKQRLSLDQEDNALAQAFLQKQVVLVARPEDDLDGGRRLAEALELGPYACAPLIGRDQIMGVLLVDNPVSGRAFSPQRKRFFELFTNQAGSALDNAGLVKRLEMAHNNLQEVQEQLIHGEKMAVLGEMAAQVAHELRNPLVSIGGFAQRLAKQELMDPKANEYASIIAREVRRMEEMLSNILAFSKKQLICLDDCSIRAVLQEVFDLEHEACQRQNIELIRNLQKDLPDIVGDYRQLRQVFLNLMINARQVMGTGGVLTVGARTGSLRGDKAVVVEVEDTGGGISPEVMRNIFNPFFSTFAKGTGLGLSISHRIIAHHQGQIEVINGEKGARFIVTLPVIQSGEFKPDKTRHE
jgi:signal transduction histidine kinase